MQSLGGKQSVLWELENSQYSLFFQARPGSSDTAVTVETSASQYLYGVYFTSLTPLIDVNPIFRAVYN